MHFIAPLSILPNIHLRIVPASVKNVINLCLAHQLSRTCNLASRLDVSVRLDLGSGIEVEWRRGVSVRDVGKFSSSKRSLVGRKSAIFKESKSLRLTSCTGI